MVSYCALFVCVIDYAFRPLRSTFSGHGFARFLCIQRLNLITQYSHRRGLHMRVCRWLACVCLRVSVVAVPVSEPIFCESFVVSETEFSNALLLAARLVHAISYVICWCAFVCVFVRLIALFGRCGSFSDRKNDLFLLR